MTRTVSHTPTCHSLCPPSTAGAILAVSMRLPYLNSLFSGRDSAPQEHSSRALHAHRKNNNSRRDSRDENTADVHYAFGILDSLESLVSELPHLCGDIELVSLESHHRYSSTPSSSFPAAHEAIPSSTCILAWIGAFPLNNRVQLVLLYSRVDSDLVPASIQTVHPSYQRILPSGVKIVLFSFGRSLRLPRLFYSVLSV